jgi:hypothetical protein
MEQALKSNSLLHSNVQRRATAIHKYCKMTHLISCALQCLGKVGFSCEYIGTSFI